MIRLKDSQSIDAAQSALKSVHQQVREATIPDDYRDADKATYLRDAFWLSSAANGGSGLRARYQRPLTTIWSTMSISVRAAGGSPVLLTKSVAAALTDVNPYIAITRRIASSYPLVSARS